ncbi:MAG: T9SS type A sorting domain-containing protein [Paludibacter sp.]|nr:T9SS type A sorting domain-containing protein [Paludibacter sp.]
MKQTILLLGLVPSISKTHSVRTQFLGLLLFFGISSSTFAASISYTGASGGNWNVASNWGGGVLPGSLDDVTINGKTVVIQSGDAITINRLLVQTSATTAGILNITGGSLIINQTTGTASNDACFLMGGTINNSAGTVSITNAITSATGSGLRLGASAGAFKASSTFNNTGSGTLSVSTPTSGNGYPCIMLNQNDAGYYPTFTIGGTITFTPNSGAATMAIDCGSTIGAIINGTGTLTAGTSENPVKYSFVRSNTGNSAAYLITIETGVTINYYGSSACIQVSTAGTTADKSATIINKGIINLGGTVRWPIYISSNNTLSACTFENQGTITANGAFSTGISGVIYIVGAGISNFTNSGNLNFNTTADQTTECSVVAVNASTVNATITNSGTINVGSSKDLTNAIVLGDSKSTFTNTGTINIASGKIKGITGTGKAAFNNNTGAVINTSKTDEAGAFDSNTIALTNNGTINYNFTTLNAIVEIVNEEKIVTPIKNAIVSNANGELTVLSFSGKVITTKKVIVGESISLPSGVYIILLTSEKKSSVQKIII